MEVANHEDGLLAQPDHNYRTDSLLFEALERVHKNGLTSNVTSGDVSNITGSEEDPVQYQGRKPRTCT